jgi:hypothetical protein
MWVSKSKPLWYSKGHLLRRRFLIGKSIFRSSLQLTFERINLEACPLMRLQMYIYKGLPGWSDV